MYATGNQLGLINQAMGGIPEGRHGDVEGVPVEYGVKRTSDQPLQWHPQAMGRRGWRLLAQPSVVLVTALGVGLAAALLDAPTPAFYAEDHTNWWFAGTNGDQMQVSIDTSSCPGLPATTYSAHVSETSTTVTVEVTTFSPVGYCGKGREGERLVTVNLLRPLGARRVAGCHHPAGYDDCSETLAQLES